MAARRFVATIGLALALLGCASDDGDEPAAATMTTEAPVVGTATPEVVCVTTESGQGLAYFGYTNDGDVPIALPVGAANEVTGPDGRIRTTSQPEVLAPGSQGVVFWVPIEEGGAETATWTLTGADGEARSATATLEASDESPACPGGVAPLEPADDRAPELVASIEVERDAAGAVVEATVEVALEGVGAASRCPAGDHGWIADAPDVQLIPEGALNAFADDEPPHATLSLTIAEPQSPIDDVQSVLGYSSINVVVDVEDRCHDEHGALVTAWAPSVGLQDLSLATHRLCFGTVDGDGDGQQDVEVVDCSLGPGLGLTGGYRLR